MLAASAANPRSLGLRQAAWAGLVVGATLTDWLDGPLARRAGPTRLGAVLDLEADSWLTLWAAIAAYRTGSLSGWSLLPPALRYVLRLARGRPPKSTVRHRAAGSGQMIVLMSALSPWPSLRRLAARIAVPVQALALAAEATA